MSARAARARGAARILALACGVLFSAPACRRKAPGPAECQAFALHVTGVRSDRELELPGAADRVDEITTQCLLTPYDRELLACVDEGVRVSRCMHAFAARHLAPNAVPEFVHPAPRELPFP